MIHHYATNGKQIVCYFDKAARDKFLATHLDWRLLKQVERNKQSQRRHKPSGYESRAGEVK